MQIDDMFSLAGPYYAILHRQKLKQKLNFELVKQRNFAAKDRQLFYRLKADMAFMDILSAIVHFVRTYKSYRKKNL